MTSTRRDFLMPPLRPFHLSGKSTDPAFDVHLHDFLADAVEKVVGVAVVELGVLSFGKQFAAERNRKALLVDSVDYISNLRDMRDAIDNIDAAMIHMLAERFRCTCAVGKLKAQYGLPPSDPKREAEQVSRLRQLAADSKLDPDFAEKFLVFVIREVIRHHESIQRNGAMQNLIIDR